jgi:hypothetical protein
MYDEPTLTFAIQRNENMLGTNIRASTHLFFDVFARTTLGPDSITDPRTGNRGKKHLYDCATGQKL